MVLTCPFPALIPLPGFQGPVNSGPNTRLPGLPDLFFLFQPPRAPSLTPNMQRSPHLARWPQSPTL